MKQWYKFSAAMRDDAGAVNAAIHKGDEPAAAKAMKKLAQSCDDCHAVFHPEQVEDRKDSIGHGRSAESLATARPNIACPMSSAKERGLPAMMISLAPIASVLCRCGSACCFGRARAAAQQPPDLIHAAVSVGHRTCLAVDLVRESDRRPGEGGKAASNLGVGRKGAPCRTIKPGETVQLCDIEGPGTIRHLWMTTQAEPANSAAW